MRIEFVVSEPFEDFEIIKGYIPEPLWRAWSGLFRSFLSVKMGADSGFLLESILS
jgi:hypothetical protein